MEKSKVLVTNATPNNQVNLDLQFFGKDGITNLDDKPGIENKEEKIKAMQEVFESGDANEVAANIVNFIDNNFMSIQTMMNDTIKDAKRANEENWDAQVLASRGVRELTNDEKKFYNAAIEAESFDEVIKLMPPTVFERVFEDLEKEHPLLSLVNFQRTGATTAWVVRKPGSPVAFWGDVTAAIQEMLDEGFRTIEQGMFKLSGFLVVSKAMFELGPKWLDRYVRAFMSEVVADELENVIVNGTGLKQPIGMIKNLESALDPGTGYANKVPVVLNNLSPQTIGEKILAPTTKGGTRRYTGVTLIVNPLDYAVKFFALGAKQKDDGTWTFNNFSIPGLSIVQSPAVPLNRMISGKPKDYFMGVGVNQKLETTDVLRMIEDQRLYLIRQLANGRPLDADSFEVFDITNIGPAAPVAPTNLTATNVTDTTLTLSWDAVNYDGGIQSYEVFRDGVSIGTTGATSFNDSGLTASTTYVYTAKAISKNGLESDLSSELTVTTAAAV